MTDKDSISTSSIAVSYNEMLDNIDFLLDHDTTLKGSMHQRLQACRVYFANALKLENQPDSNKSISVNKYEVGKVEFKFAIAKPIPSFLGKEQLQSAVVPILEDRAVYGLIMYQGFDEGAGYYNYYFSGMCPNHKRVHDGQAWKWVLKIKKDKSFAGFKCWRDETFYKICCIEQLLP